MQECIVEINNTIIESQRLMGILEQKLVEKKVDKKWYGELIETDNVVKTKRELLNESYVYLLKMREYQMIQEVPVVSYRPKIGRFITLYKRIFRKMTSWIFAYYIEQQIQFNQETVEAIDSIIELNKKLLEEINSGD